MFYVVRNNNIIVIKNSNTLLYVKLTFLECSSPVCVILFKNAPKMFFFINLVHLNFVQYVKLPEWNAPVCYLKIVARLAVHLHMLHYTVNANNVQFFLLGNVIYLLDHIICSITYYNLQLEPSECSFREKNVMMSYNQTISRLQD